MPFGFTPENPDEPDNSHNPFGFNNFNEIFRQFSGMGLNIQGLLASLSGQTTPNTLSKQMIRDISRKYLSAHGEQPVSVSELNAIREAFNIADLWLNDATIFPPMAIPEICAISRRDWIETTLTGWEEIAQPLVEGINSAMSQMLNENLGEGDQPLSQLGIPGMNISKSGIASIMGTFMSSLISTQLGQTIGQLSTSVTGANDVAMPLATPTSPYLIPQNLRAWGEGLEIDETEIRIYLALRELAAARLFNAAPWLRGYIKESIAKYGKGIHVDITAITQQAQDAMNSGEIDPTNPESLSLALSGGMFTPEESDAQRAAIEKLETVLALVEGWIDAVVERAANNRLPSILRLRETQQRRRATNSPTQQLFASLVGLEVSPRKMREAMSFCQKIVELEDVAFRDRIWEEAFLLPTSDQLLDPENFIKSRIVPDDLSSL